MVASVEGVRVDAVLYAQLSPEDVTLVRAAFRDGLDELDEEFDEEVAPESSSGDGEGLDVGPANVGADESEDEDEAEIARLQDELTQSARLQAALERYLDIVREPS